MLTNLVLSNNLVRVSTIIIPIRHVRKLSLKGLSDFSRCHVAYKLWRQGMNAGQSSFRVYAGNYCAKSILLE